MPNEKTEKKVRRRPVPQNPDSITAGAMALPFDDRVNLCKLLKESIIKEVADRQAAASQASKLSEGL